MRGWIDVAALRERVRRMVQLACREDGLDDADVDVQVYTRRGGPPKVTIAIEDRRDVDGTDPRWESIRRQKWQDN